MIDIKQEENSICQYFSSKLRNIVPKRLSKKEKIEKDHSDSESFQPEFHQFKILGLPLNHKKIKKGAWDLQEQIKYLQYLKHYKEDFRSEEKRRYAKVFRRLSKQLKNRTPDQCRSHHQKLQIKFPNNFERIIEEVENKIEMAKREVEEERQREEEVCKEEEDDLTNLKKEEIVRATADEQIKEEEELKGGEWFNMTQKGDNLIILEINFSQIQHWQE